MPSQKIVINNKSVWLSEPYVPNSLKMPVFVGREREMELIMASWMAASNAVPLAPLLVGPPGVGKNRIIYELARLTNRELFIFQGHEDISAEDLGCTVRFSDASASVMDYVISPLVTAMVRGAIFFLDEIGKIRPRALSLLASVLDERRYLDSTLLGERIYADPNFRFIAATNSGEVGLIPEFIRSRVRPVIKIDYSSKEEVEKIVALHFKSRMENLNDLLERFWYKIDEMGAAKNPPTPRDAIAVFSMAASLSNFESSRPAKKLRKMAVEDVFALNETDSSVAVSYPILERAINELFA